MCDGLLVHPFSCVRLAQRKVSMRKIGVEFEFLKIVLYYPVIPLLASEVFAVAPCNDERQRIQFVGTFHLHLRSVQSSHSSQEAKSVPLMRHGVIWVERNSTLEFFLGTFPVPVAEKTTCQRIVRLRKPLIHLESRAGRCFRL